MRNMITILLAGMVFSAGCSAKIPKITNLPKLPKLSNPFADKKKDVNVRPKMESADDIYNIAPVVGDGKTRPEKAPERVKRVRKGPILPDAGLFERDMLCDELTTDEEVRLEGCQMHNNMGVLELQKGHLEKAEQRFLLAVKLVPDHVESLNNLGTVFLKLKKNADALKAFKEAIRIATRLPDFSPQLLATIYTNLGDTYRENRDFTEAIEAYQTAYQLNENDARIHYGLGQVHLKQVGLSIEHARQAVYRFNKALNLSPEYNEALLGRAMSWYALNNQEKALADIMELEKRHLDVDPSFKRSVIQQMRKNQEAAAKKSTASHSSAENN